LGCANHLGRDKDSDADNDHHGKPSCVFQESHPFKNKVSSHCDLRDENIFDPMASSMGSFRFFPTQFRITRQMKHFAVNGSLLFDRRNPDTATVAPHPVIHSYWLGNGSFHCFPLLGFGSASASCF
jgi:hypothetical protein